MLIPSCRRLRNSAVFDIMLHPQPVCQHHNTEILKMKSTTKSSSAVFQRRVSSSSNPSASSSCHCRSPSLFFTLLPCARQYCTCNGWLVSNIWVLLLEPKLWEIVLLAAPDALSYQLEFLLSNGKQRLNDRKKKTLQWYFMRRRTFFTLL